MTCATCFERTYAARLLSPGTEQDVQEGWSGADRHTKVLLCTTWRKSSRACRDAGRSLHPARIREAGRNSRSKCTDCSSHYKHSYCTPELSNDDRDLTEESISLFLLPSTSFHQRSRPEVCQTNDGRWSLLLGIYAKSILCVTWSCST